MQTILVFTVVTIIFVRTFPRPSRHESSPLTGIPAPTIIHGVLLRPRYLHLPQNRRREQLLHRLGLRTPLFVPPSPSNNHIHSSPPNTKKKKTTVGISFAVSIPFVLLAFNIDKFKIAWIRLKHSANKNTAFLFLKPLRSSRSIPSERVRDTGGRWYKEWIDFIAKHDLPFKPDGEMGARLRREVDGEEVGAAGRAGGWNDFSDSSDEGEDTSDEEEVELVMRQQRREGGLLARMGG